MIDIHAHVLYGVDDGPKDLEDSLKLCRDSAASGVEVVVATPHLRDGIHIDHEISFLEGKVEELNSILCGKPRVELGCELRLTHEMVRLICVDRKAPTIAGGPYVLIELPFSVIPLGTERVLFELMGNNIRPIIAHPERNAVLIDDPGQLYHLVDSGIAVQIDAGSITGYFGRRVRKTAKIMLECGLAHILASDCHNVRSRVPALPAGMAAAAEIVGEEAARIMVNDNPAAVLKGSSLPWWPENVMPKKKKWFLF